jgi:hypothetical protein
VDKKSQSEMMQFIFTTVFNVFTTVTTPPSILTTPPSYSRMLHCSAAAYENNCLDMDSTAPVCNLEWQDGNFIIAYS